LVAGLLSFLVASLGATVLRIRRAKLQLKKSREEYRLVVENANEAILVAQDDL